MVANSYKNVNREDLILRDYLAIDRTLLSVERTFLSYLRTSLTFLIAGASFIKFFNEPLIVGLGWIFLPIGITVFAAGLHRCITMCEDIYLSKQEKFDFKHINSFLFQIYLFFAKLFQLTTLRFNNVYLRKKIQK